MKQRVAYKSDNSSFLTWGGGGGGIQYFVEIPVLNANSINQWGWVQYFVEIPVLNANSVNPAASDLGLHCLPNTLMGIS